MIKVVKSPKADTRSTDVSTVSKEELMDSSLSHIGDVGKALGMFSSMLVESAAAHDYDKLSKIDWFYSDFQTNFKETGWWDNHRQIHRHHLGAEDGVPDDVNLVDVIEYISDCVMAGMARKGELTYPVTIDPKVLQLAFDNTIELLKSQVEVEE